MATLTLRALRPPQWAMYCKRSADFLLALLGLLIFSPLLALIALMVKLDSAGSVFYFAPRMGKKGATFVCHKFRTMVADAEKTKEKLRTQNQRNGPFFKIAADPRITRIGRWLRRYSLDELPQLWNVVKGEMSLVGPRPHPVDDFQRYQVNDFRRLNVIPGMTGLWQVSARCDPSFERNMQLDLEYIEHWSLWLDLRILARTFGVVLRGSGA